VKLFPDQARFTTTFSRTGTRSTSSSNRRAGGSTTIVEIAHSWKFLVGGDTFGTSNSKDATEILAERGLGLGRAHNMRKLLTAREYMTKPHAAAHARGHGERYSVGPQALLIVDRHQR
jgi:hypothetical protein